MIEENDNLCCLDFLDLLYLNRTLLTENCEAFQIAYTLSLSGK